MQLLIDSEDVHIIPRKRMNITMQNQAELIVQYVRLTWHRTRVVRGRYWYLWMALIEMQR